MNKPNSLEGFSRAADLLLSGNWIFAKTMPQNPHHYMLRKHCNEDDFVWLVEYIREYGYPNVYWKKVYTVFDVNDCFYWTMGAPIEDTILINRKKKNHAQYDDFADSYDSFFKDDASIKENKQVAELLGYKSGRALEIGCGTGLMYDYLGFDEYTGVDPSRKMLDVFMKKHSFLDVELVCSDFESFAPDGKYDFIFATFGSASYVSPGFLLWIKGMLAPGGSYSLMFYKPDYHPVTYNKAGVECSHFIGGEDLIEGTKIDMGNYVMVKGPVCQ